MAGFPSISSLGQYLSRLGPGARGIVHGIRNGGQSTGHFFNAVDQGGKIRYLDAQTGAAADLEGFSHWQFLTTFKP